MGGGGAAPTLIAVRVGAVREASGEPWGDGLSFPGSPVTTARQEDFCFHCV